MHRLLGEIEFHDSVRASDNIARLAKDLGPEAQGRFRSLLSISADPDSALHFLERLHREQPDSFARLTVSPAGLQVLFAVFSYSRFL
ncbi:MAG: hypothetical protein M1541_04990, partial [Acidobacteria bacterium]|nr:hypothetical protein [Acidobacteriota bacterium]